MIALLALLVVGTPTTSTSTTIDLRTVCLEAPPACRAAAGQAIVTWRERAEVCAVELGTARAQLEARTPDTVAALVPIPAVEPERPATHVSPFVAAVLTVTALVAGTLFGALAL